MVSSYGTFWLACLGDEVPHPTRTPRIPVVAANKMEPQLSIVTLLASDGSGELLTRSCQRLLYSRRLFFDQALMFGMLGPFIVVIHSPPLSPSKSTAVILAKVCL
jgi:hypothetical protein